MQTIKADPQTMAALVHATRTAAHAFERDARAIEGSQTGEPHRSELAKTFREYAAGAWRLHEQLEWATAGEDLVLNVRGA